MWYALLNAELLYNYMPTHITSAKDVSNMSLAGPIPSPPKGHTWHGLMGLALQEAEKARTLYVLPEVPVGAVLVSAAGEILALAHNKCISLNDPTAHAEILALRYGAEKTGNYRLNDAVLVVTLEPCLMCAGALIHSRISGLVYGAQDKKAGAISSCCEGLEYSFLNHKLWHMGGMRSEECSAILRDFFEMK